MDSLNDNTPFPSRCPCFFDKYDLGKSWRSCCCSRGVYTSRPTSVGTSRTRACPRAQARASHTCKQSMRGRPAARRVLKEAAAAIKRRAAWSFVVAILGCSSNAIAETGETPPAQVRNRLGVSISQDFGVHAGQDVCSQSSQLEDGYACFRASGTQYHGAPLPTRGGQVNMAPTPATTRLLAGYERLVLPSLTLGVWLGWVLAGGGPKPSGAAANSFLPFHGELRAGYLFGVRPLENPGLGAGVFLGAGIAQFDTAYSVSVQEDTSKPQPRSQLDNPENQMLLAYRKSGTGFVSGRASVFLTLSPRVFLSLGLALTKTFPSTGTLVSPELASFLSF